MTSEEVEKIIKGMPDDTHDILINGFNDAAEAMCEFADYMRENFVPMSVIAEIQAEIDDEWYRVKLESYERAEGLEMADEIIRKHISGGEQE